MAYLVYRPFLVTKLSASWILIQLMKTSGLNQEDELTGEQEDGGNVFDARREKGFSKRSVDHTRSQDPQSTGRREKPKPVERLVEVGSIQERIERFLATRIRWRNGLRIHSLALLK